MNTFSIIVGFISSLIVIFLGINEVPKDTKGADLIVIFIILLVLAFIVGYTIKGILDSFFGMLSVGVSKTLGTAERCGTKAKNSVKNVASKAANMKQDIIDSRELKDADLYREAELEFDNNIIDDSLYALALIKANGDESKRKSSYMKLRVIQLKRSQ